MAVLYALRASITPSVKLLGFYKKMTIVKSFMILIE